MLYCNEKTLSFYSLGFQSDDLKRDYRGIRLEAVHFRGVDNMHTKDVFKYFEDFGPGGVEWIDDSSCKIDINSFTYESLTGSSPMKMK